MRPRISWSNVLAVLVALWLGAYCAGCAWLSEPPKPAPALPHEIVIADEVLQNLFEIQAEYGRETVRCLTGFTVADTVFISGVEPTWINRSDSVSVNFRGCTALGTIGWYHNHPGWRSPAGDVVSVCWIEDEDVKTLRGFPNFLVAVITCDDKFTVVWKFKDSNINYQHTFPPDAYAIGRAGGAGES